MDVESPGRQDGRTEAGSDDRGGGEESTAAGPVASAVTLTMPELVSSPLAL